MGRQIFGSLDFRGPVGSLGLHLYPQLIRESETLCRVERLPVLCLRRRDSPAIPIEERAEILWSETRHARRIRRSPKFRLVGPASSLEVRCASATTMAFRVGTFASRHYHVPAMALIDSIRLPLRNPQAASFQLWWDDFQLLGPDELAAAVDEYRKQSEGLGAAQRQFLAQAHAAFRKEAHEFLRRHNTNVHRRIEGYLQLGRRMRFDYPWPTVAVLGICQVIEGMKKNRGWAMAGDMISRLGSDALVKLSDNSEDLLRRTNRGIFADSVPTVLYALRVLDHARRGEHELVNLLVHGPLPITFDEENRAIIAELVAALQLDDADTKFARLSKLTLRHFAREQAIFTYHLSGHLDGEQKKSGGLGSKLFALREVDAPIIERDRKERKRLAFQSYKLPRDFDIRDHETRVREFGRAFVSSVTASREDYQVATDYAVKRFGE